MNFDGLTGLPMLVSFNCDHCTAVLSIPEELAGISGPCPFCGTVVTSPRPDPPAPVVQEVHPPVAEEAPPPRDEPVSRKPWRQPQIVPVEHPALPFGRQRLALKVAACAALFVGGVAGTWRIWHGNSRQQQETGPSPAPVGEAPAPRRIQPSEITGSVDNLPPPSDTIPAPLPAAPAAVARNVSTAPSPRVAVAARPAAVLAAPPEAPTLFPETASGVQTADSGSATPAAKPAAPETSADEKRIRDVVPAKGILSKPGETLVKFFSAKTWQDRLKYTLAADKVKPFMESYYKVHKDGMIVPEEVELMRMDPVEDDANRHYFAFLVYFPDRFSGVPISVEETKDGCLVEWTSFVEGKDMLLEKFYRKYQKEPGTFRVLLRRGHYFEKDVPDQKSKVVFDINPPDRTGPYKLWMDKNSPEAKKYFRDDQLEWNQVLMMVVTLQWEKTAEGAEYVRLKKVAGDSWHPELVLTPDGETARNN